MSDLYLELRSRIPIVAQQTHLGEARLQDAQNAVGLSNEGVARAVPVSEKTWRRWKKLGAIPTASLPAVARALRLDLKELEPDVDERVAALEAESVKVRQELDELRAVRAGVDRIEALLREQLGQPRDGTAAA
jgi:hypothetical protein